LNSDAFDKTVSSLKNGQVSQPVKTQYGYHIIEAETPANQIPSFEAEKARLTAEVEKNKVATVYSDTVNSLNETIVGNDSLDAVVQQVKGTKIESLNGVTLATQNPQLSDPNVKIKLFNDDVKNGDRNASSNIQLANGDTVWVKVRTSNLSVQQISNKVGYSSETAFSQAFKRVFDLSPKQYRQNYIGSRDQ